MKTEAEIYKAVMVLADATPGQLDKVHKQLWDKSKAVRKQNEKYYVKASDIAALVRDRRRKNK